MRTDARLPGLCQQDGHLLGKQWFFWGRKARSVKPALDKLTSPCGWRSASVPLCTRSPIWSLLTCTTHYCASHPTSLPLQWSSRSGFGHCQRSRTRFSSSGKGTPQTWKTMARSLFLSPSWSLGHSWVYFGNSVLKLSPSLHFSSI